MVPCVCTHVWYLYAVAFSHCGTHSEGRWRYAAHAIQQRQTHTSSCSSARLTCKHRQTPECKATYTHTHTYTSTYTHHYWAHHQCSWVSRLSYLFWCKACQKKKSTHSRPCPSNIHTVPCSSDHQKLDQAEIGPLSPLQEVFPCSNQALKQSQSATNILNTEPIIHHATIYHKNDNNVLPSHNRVSDHVMCTVNSKQIPAMMCQLKGLSYLLNRPFFI